ncbi:alpha/beta fold hydrolase [Komagataeibacter sp. AV436]|uniref:Alpha/beta fold hydrolase n=1 Tax=Komagataeibacter melomenusus TaxID=2766578 RepID=A0ABX2AAP0_9PROT|nr:alpha/beta hydrolase [Komagataeibacter melomenusus]MBV1829373.1 alpha/beta hydrolase [Komagataeibacter melomenusus]NPC64944.1 alpha/beta fold hydrolase [Komagataeibacter melomenusus]
MSAALPVAFVHGWAFDPTFWAATRTALGTARTRCLDFGFFSPRAHMDLPQVPYIGVGHSLGTLWLLRHHGPLCRGLILINGFSRFGAGPDFTAGIARRVIERMRQGLLRAPQGLLHSFRLRAGIDSPVPEPIARDRLETGLDALMDMDCRADLHATTCPVHVMAGTQDAIAPPALTKACFTARPIEWVEGGHLLPLTHAGACAHAITTMARRITPS